MIRLESYVEDAWKSGGGEGRPFVDPTRGERLGIVDCSGVDIGAAVDHVRKVGGGALRAMTFAERGALLGAIADVLSANRAAYQEIARCNSGNTARDAAIDIDGGVGTLKYYARIGKGLGATRALIEDGADQLNKLDTFRARHIWTSRPGVALHINAYNFPAWGLWEKVAVAFLAGAPVVAKPASATAWLAERMVRDVAAAGVLPPGAMALICGAGEGLIEAAAPFDSIAFTGSAQTGDMIRRHPRVLEAAPRVTIEADSVNVALLAPDAAPGSVAYAQLVRQTVDALSVKAGQLCTNIRRILVPDHHASGFAETIRAEVEKLVIGDPAIKEVALGPLVDERQRRAAIDGLARLTAEARAVCGGGAPRSVSGADPRKGAFLAPTLLVAPSGDGLSAVHELEVFGPVATLIPYRSREEAVSMVARGEGSLAASLYCEDPAVGAALALEIAPMHGRALVIDPVVGKDHTGHAIVMPQCAHGGPGRAGGGEELGGMRALRFYMQRTALQGSPALLEAVAAAAANAAM